MVFLVARGAYSLFIKISWLPLLTSLMSLLFLVPPCNSLAQEEELIDEL